MDNQAESSGRLTELSENVCRELLRTKNFGRLGFVETGDRAAIVPINYRFDGNGISFRTDPGTKLDSVPLTWVALEIDEVAADGSWGWSVVARGWAFDISTLLWNPCPRGSATVICRFTCLKYPVEHLGFRQTLAIARKLIQRILVCAMIRFP
jgi:hypothetical protein